MQQPIQVHAATIAMGVVEPVWFEKIGDKPTPTILLQTALIGLGPKTSDGQIVRAVTPPWLQIFHEIERNPELLFEFVNDPWKFEEFIAGAYKQDGWEVELAPQPKQALFHPLAGHNDLFAHPDVVESVIAFVHAQAGRRGDAGQAVAD